MSRNIPPALRDIPKDGCEEQSVFKAVNKKSGWRIGQIPSSSKTLPILPVRRSLSRSHFHYFSNAQGQEWWHSSRFWYASALLWYLNQKKNMRKQMIICTQKKTHKQQRSYFVIAFRTFHVECCGLRNTTDDCDTQLRIWYLLRSLIYSNKFLAAMKLSILLPTCNKSPFVKLIRLLKARLQKNGSGPVEKVEKSA